METKLRENEFKLVNTFCYSLGVAKCKAQSKERFCKQEACFFEPSGFFRKMLISILHIHNCYRYFPFFTRFFLRENDFIYTCLVLKDCNECLHSFGPLHLLTWHS